MVQALRIISLILALAAATLQGAAAQSRLLVSPMGDDVKKVAAGGVSTVLFRVEPSGLDTLDVSHAITLPEGWALVGRPAIRMLIPGVAQNLLVAFRVSPRAVPDTSLVALHLLANNGDTLATGIAGISVDEVRTLQAGVLSAPRAAPTQDEHTVRFSVTNSGNIRQAIDIRVHSSLGFEIGFAPQRVQLAAFSSEEVVVTIRPDARIDGRHRHVLSLVATAEAEGADRPTARAQSETTVLPRGRSLAARGPSLPIRIGLTASGTSSAGAGQFDVAVPEWRVADGIATLTVRGPSAQSAGAFTTQDFYQASYARHGFSARLGDQYVRQTELVTQGAPGFGLHLAGPIGRFEASAYALQSRFGFPTRDRQGFTMATPLSRALRVSLNAAAERYTSSSYAATLRADWSPDKTKSAHVEAGLGSYDGRTGHGFSAKARWAGSGRRIDIRYNHGAPDFPGSYRGSRQLSGAASIDATRFLTLDASTVNSRRSYDFSLSAPTTQHQSRVGASTTLSLPLGLRLRTSISGNVRSNSSPAQGIGRSETFAAGSTSLTAGGITASASIEAGSMDDPTGSHTFGRTDLMFYFRYGFASVSLTANVDQGARVFYPVDSRRRQLGGSLDLKLARTLNLDFQYYFNDVSAPYWNRMHYGEAELRYTLPFGHQVGVQGRLVSLETDYRTSTELAGGLSYQIPLDLPVGRPAPGVHGRVLLAETGDPVRDVLVSLGEQTVLTDEGGRFYLATRPGSTPAVDAGLVDPGLVLMNPDALLLNEGGSIPVELYLVPGATVSGSLELDDRADRGVIHDDVDQEDLRVYGITVAATAGRETRHAMTGVDGTFHFIGLPPGTWTLSPVAGTLPAGFKPVLQPVTVEVGQGRPLQLNVPVARRSRAVRMVGAASLSLASPSESNANTLTTETTHESDSVSASASDATRPDADPVVIPRANTAATENTDPAVSSSALGLRPSATPASGIRVGTAAPDADAAMAPRASALVPDLGPASTIQERVGQATNNRPVRSSPRMGLFAAAMLAMLLIFAVIAVFRRQRGSRPLHAAGSRRAARLRLVKPDRRTAPGTPHTGDREFGVKPAA